MKCPFELPVKAAGRQRVDKNYYFRAECKHGIVLFICPTKADVDYIVQAINSHEKLRKLLQDALPHIECKNNSQSGLITEIGEYLEQALKEAEKP